LRDLGFSAEDENKISMKVDNTLPFDTNKTYDAVVIGGGTGGLSFTKHAKKLGLSVAVFNYVRPTPKHKFKWGIGGTCVNVGCVPKKLFHNAGLIKQAIHMGKDYGWDVELKNNKVKWERLRSNVQTHIRSLNDAYDINLKKIQADSINAEAMLGEEGEANFTYNGKEYVIKADNFIIATGGRPRYLENIPGSNFKFEEEAITSDDLFALEKNPGKTLVVGGGYIGKVYLINEFSY